MHTGVSIEPADRLRDRAEKALGLMSPHDQRPYFDAWKGVNDALVSREAAKRPRPKVFEVHHFVVTAQAAFYTGIVAGKPADQCASAARAAIGL